MNTSFKLLSFREYRNWTLEDVARELGISVELYKELEEGKTKMNGIIAQKLSDLYRTPIEFFLIDNTPYYYQSEVLYSHCSFSSHQGASGYINHNNADRGIDEILHAKNSEIKDLKQEMAALREQNNKLLELIGDELRRTAV